MNIPEKKILDAGLALTFFFPVLGFFFRTGFLGYDSYYFLAEVCGGNPIYNPQTNFLANMIIQTIPCNEFIIKVFLVLLFWASLVVIYNIGRLFGEKEATILTIFTGITPILINNSFKLENDSFAFPIMFLGVYFFLKYLVNNKQNKLHLVTSVLLIGVSLFFWGGGIYYFIPFALAEPLLLIITIPILIVFGGLMLEQITPRLRIAENHPIKGVINFMFYIAFIMFGSGKKLIEFYFPLVTIFFIALGLINPKFMILGLPFYALAVLKIYNSATPENKKRILLFAITLNVAWSLSLFFHTTSPSYSEMIGAKETVEYANEFDLNISNDWQFGHLIIYNGGKTLQHSTFGDYNLLHMPGKAILTRQELDCEKIKNYDNPIGIPPLNLYRC